MEDLARDLKLARTYQWLQLTSYQTWQFLGGNSGSSDCFFRGKMAGWSCFHASKPPCMMSEIHYETSWQFRWVMVLLFVVDWRPGSETKPRRNHHLMSFIQWNPSRLVGLPSLVLRRPSRTTTHHRYCGEMAGLFYSYIPARYLSAYHLDTWHPDVRRDLQTAFQSAYLASRQPPTADKHWIIPLSSSLT